MRVAAVILAAGRGERFGGDKVLELLGGKPVWRWSFDTFLSHPSVSFVGVVGSESNLASLGSSGAAFLIVGGDNRQESSRLGIEASDADIVLIHDAARPFVTPEAISRVIEAIQRTGAAAAATGVVDTLRFQGESGYEIVDRARTVAMQTPQGGNRGLLLRAHREAAELYTDEMALLQALGVAFEIVDGDPGTFKITTAHDLDRARAMVEGVEFRTGLGYDIHAFATDERPLMLGGVEFPAARGLEGHSDADVVLHAVVDALLGAAGLGDIGQHFPNTDERWRGEPSSTFVGHAAELLRAEGWQVMNVDISVIAETPKVMSRAVEVRDHIAGILGVEASRVSFKATTNERLGALGREEGIAAFAVTSIRR